MGVVEVVMVALIQYLFLVVSPSDMSLCEMHWRDFAQKQAQ